MRLGLGLGLGARPTQAPTPGGVEEIRLPTMYARSPRGAGRLKANVILPQARVPEAGAQLKVKAHMVVLFLHGSGQGPTAYARMLTELAEDGNLVIAPCPDFSLTPEEQQASIVEAALYWRDLIARNKLPGLELMGGAASSCSLLGHSVGGGLAPYIVHQAAMRGQPFAAAHVLAPRTSQVVDKYRYNSTENKDRLLAGVGTTWGVQHGGLDPFSLTDTVEDFRFWLEEQSTRNAGSASYTSSVSQDKGRTPTPV